jgi:uncharacterized membrane protein
MDAALIVGLWALMFVGGHLLISSEAIRPGLIKRVGEQPYRGIYSIIALGTFIPLVIEFANHKHAGPIVWYLRAIPALRWLVWVMMLLSMILLVSAFVTPNPGAIGAAADNRVRGILKITRHPTFVAIAIFAIAHILMNGWLGDLFFFGSLAVLAIVGGMHQDYRKRRELGAPYEALIASTSFFPFAALITGRQRWTAADVSWVAIGAGAGLTVIFLVLHPVIFGGHPLG